MDISKSIRAIREEKRLTQLEVAEKLQMERSNYARLEARGNKLSVEQLEQIAEALGVSVIELLTGETAKVVDSEREKELEKRVGELEDRIKDKEELLSNIHERYSETSYYLTLFIKKKINEKALQRKIGYIKAHDRNAGKDISGFARDFEFSDFEFKPFKNLLRFHFRSNKTNYVLYDVVLTLQEKKELVQVIDEQHINHFDLFDDFFFDCGVFILMGHYEDKEFTMLYREFHKGKELYI